MDLEAQPPTWVLEAVAQGESGVGLDFRPVHGLEEEVLEIEPFQSLRRHIGLGEDELQLLTSTQEKFRPSLRADRDPVDSRGRPHRTIGLYGDFEPPLLESGDEPIVELQQRLAASADD